MRLLGVTMVRNEADVVEAFVRHNLGILDGLAIVDHGSVDGTSEILAKLQAEGLPLRVVHDADPAHRQWATMTARAREALAGAAADFVFALDADEFLKVPSRAALERALAEVPAGVHALIHWLTYVPDAFDGAPGGFGPGHLWWRVKDARTPLYKVVAGRGLLQRPEDKIVAGNYRVQSDIEAAPRPHARLREDVVALAHCPVRSRGQLVGKIVVGYLAHLLARPTDQHLAHHWRRLYDELRDGADFTEERLREIASNYALPRKQWRPTAEIELVEDPVQLTAEQRYRLDSAPDPLRLLMRFTEALIAAKQAPAPPAKSATLYYAL
jgi:glycosyl transferase family 2